MTTDIAVIVSKPPARAWTPELDRLVNHIADTVGALHFNRYHAESLRAAIIELEPLARHIGDVDQRISVAQAPANREEIAKCLTLLIAAYPNASSKGDLSTFGRMLVEDVASLEPSIAAVDKACRELRQTKAFVPAIAEVIAAVRDADKRLATCHQLLASLPEQLTEARGKLEYLERAEAESAATMRRRREHDEVRRTQALTADQRRDIRVRLRLGMDVRGADLDPELVEQAVAEWESANGRPYQPTFRGTAH